MAIRTLGYTGIGNKYTWNHVDDDDPYADYYFEERMPFNLYTVQYPIYGDVTAYYYLNNNTMNCGDDCYPVIYADNGGKLGEKLSYNEPLMQTDAKSSRTNGWKTGTVKMKRTVQPGEKIWFGWFGYMLAPVYTAWNEYSVFTIDWDYTVDIGHPPTETIGDGRLWIDDYRPKNRISMYLQYDDEPPSVAYSRNLAETIGLYESVTRRFSFLRTFAEITNGFEVQKKSTNFLRQSTSNISITDTHKHSKGFGIWLQEVLRVDDMQRNWRALLRLFTSAGGISEQFSCRRTIQRCIQNIKEVIDTVKANAFYVRMVKHCFAVFDSIKISRLLKVQLYELCKPIQNLFVSRCIFRLVSEVCGLWERLIGRRGVHRVEVLLYSPITLEIELTGGKNMKKIFTGQSSLRMIVDCNINLIGEVEAKIYAEKPNGSTVAFVCFVLDAEKGKIAFDVTDSHTFDVSGLWKLCSHITFNDGRSVQGDPTNMYVFEAMKSA